MLSTLGELEQSGCVGLMMTVLVTDPIEFVTISVTVYVPPVVIVGANVGPVEVAPLLLIDHA